MKTVIADPSQLGYCHECRVIVAAHTPCQHTQVILTPWPSWTWLGLLLCLASTAACIWGVVILGQWASRLLWGG